MTKTFDKHMAAIRSGEVDRGTVIGIRKALNNMERISNGWSPNRIAMTVEEAGELESVLYDRHPKVVGDLHETGLAVLRNKRYAKRLAPYKDIIDSITHFTLGEYERIGRRSEYAVPVYRAHSPHGILRFMNIPWQSGGDGPEVL